MAFYQFDDGEVIELDFAPHGHAKKLSAKAGKLAIAEQAKEKLRKIFPPGSTVYTALRAMHQKLAKTSSPIGIIITMADMPSGIPGCRA